MFSLDWVQNKAQVMGSAHLINDYVEHGGILDQEVHPVSLHTIEIAPISMLNLDPMLRMVVKFKNVALLV